MPVIFILAGAGSIGFLTLFFIELRKDGKWDSRVEVTRLHTPIEEKLPAHRSTASSQVSDEAETKTENTTPIDWLRQHTTAEARTWTQAR